MIKSLFLSVKRNQVQGFTLVEMAIVLVIFGLMIAMFLSPLSAQRDIQNRAETQILLNEAKEALIGFAITNGRLPCTDTTQIPDGEEDRDPTNNGRCDSDNTGTLPWNTLGIKRTDAWDHYLSYRVDKDFSNSKDYFNINHAEGSSGITIISENGSSLISTNSRPAAVVFSFGENGYGGINTNQNVAYNKEPDPSGADELENTDNDVTFVSHPPTSIGSSSGEFDDMLIWISPKVLINRMIMAERLP